MNTKKSNKHKRIIYPIIAVIILVAVIVAVTIYVRTKKPQVLFAQALLKTIDSVNGSETDSAYGISDICGKMIEGNQSIAVYDAEGGSEETVPLISWNRNSDSQTFLAEENLTDKNIKLYVNSRTSIIYIDDMAVKVEYADNLVTQMSNSALAALLNIDSDVIRSVGSSYEQLMRLAAGNYKSETTQKEKDDNYKDAVKYFLELEGQQEKEEYLTVGGRDERCILYSVSIDTDEIKNVLETRYGMGDVDIDPLMDTFTNNNLKNNDAESIDNIKNMLHDIKQVASELFLQDEIKIYFDINDSGELVRLYTDSVSDEKISLSLCFDGEDYIAQSWKISIGSEKGGTASIAVDFCQGSEDRLGIELDCDGLGDRSYEKTFEYDIRDYEKGRYIELDSGSRLIRVGCSSEKIKKPDYADSIDILSADVLSLYRFISEVK